MRRYIHRYTLTEILVAVAVLMLMMTFLMQFVIGSQRIWYASSRTSSLFDKAQVVFGIMETDLKQSLFSNEKGENIPMYIKNETDAGSAVGSKNTSVKLGLVTQLRSTDEKLKADNEKFETFSAANQTLSEYIVRGTAFPVLYHYDRDNYRLYRLALDTTSYKVSNAQKPFVNVNLYYGIDYEHASLTDSIFEQIANYFDEEVKEVIADDLLDFSIEMVPNATFGGNGFLKERPKAVRVTLTLFDHEKYPDYKLRGDLSSSDDKLAQEQKILEEARTFSKVIFVQ